MLHLSLTHSFARSEKRVRARVSNIESSWSGNSPSLTLTLFRFDLTLFVCLSVDDDDEDLSIGAILAPFNHLGLSLSVFACDGQPYVLSWCVV